MTLQSLMAADTAAIFLNTGELAQSVTHYRRGDMNVPATITALVELDDQPDHEPAIDDERGAKRSRRGRLWMATSVTVDSRERQEGRSLFLIGTELWRAEKTIVEETQTGMQCVRIVREEPIQSNRLRTGP